MERQAAVSASKRRLGLFLYVHAQQFLVGKRDVLSPIPKENGPRLLLPLGVIGMDCEEDTAGFDAVMVTVGGMFGKSKSEQGADQTSTSGTDAGSHQRSEYRTGGNACSQSRDA